MAKRGSALMQVLVVGLIVAAFAVLMLRYAVTRSANLSRTERILESQIVADSCMDQYMAAFAMSELYGQPFSNVGYGMDCIYYNPADSDTPSNIWISGAVNGNTVIASFTVPSF